MFSLVFFQVLTILLKNGNHKELSPRKVGQIEVLLQEPCLNREKLQKNSISPQKGLNLDSKRIRKCSRKRKTSPRLDRKIVKMALKNMRLSYIAIARLLAEEEVHFNPRTVNNRLLEAVLKAYRPRKKPRLTQKICNPIMDGSSNMLNGLQMTGRRYEVSHTILKCNYDLFYSNHMKLILGNSFISKYASCPPDAAKCINFHSINIHVFFS